MTASGPAGDPRALPPDDGGRAKRRRRRHFLAVALAVIAAIAAIAGYGGMQAAQDSAPSTKTQAAAAGTDAATRANASTNPATSAMPPHEFGDTTPDLKDVIPPGTEPGVAEVIARLRAAGIDSGIAAFNPPGTSPPLVGIAVPEDFPLPEGFVRHGQATDDGQPIEPILMFSPDYEFFDSRGQPIPVPDDRVVPPQYAPPGLPIRLIRIPPPL